MLRKPPRLRSGDVLGVAAPAGAVARDELLPGIDALRAAGFGVQYRDDLFATHRYFAGSTERRVAELRDLLHDPNIRAILCARGGYGTQAIMPHLDLDCIAGTPKILVGYSDITILQGALRQRGWATFYGPTICRHLHTSAPHENLDRLLRALTDSQPLGALPAPALRVIKPGTAEGALSGGCLSLLHCAIGTSYQWPLEGICFLEDRGEKIYALDRMLTHLQHAGAFARVRGIIFGSMLLHPDEPQPDDLDTMLAECFADFDGPVLAGFPAGHCDPFITLPLGCQATLTSDPPGLIIREGAVE